MAFLEEQTSTDAQDFLDDLRTHMEANGFTQDRYATSVIDSNNDDWIGHGSGSGSDEIYIGMRTFYDSSADVYNIEIAGMSGYASGSSWENQPDISPGRFNGGSAALQYGHYLPLDNGTITWWASSTSRRVYGVCKIGTAYMSFYAGWLNQYGTTGEFNYPLLVAGTTAKFDAAYNATAAYMGSIADPQGINASTNGPMSVRDPGGNWRAIRNATVNDAGTTRAVSNARVAWPSGKLVANSTTLPDPADRWFDGTYEWDDVIPQLNIPGLQTAKLYKTDDSGGDVVTLFPVTVMCRPDANESLLAGELDGVFWVSGAAGQTDGGLSAEDTITIGVDTYFVFPSASKTNDFNFFAIKEA